MSEIIQKWLLNRLGVIFDMTPEVFARQAASGRLVAELLYNYGVILYDQMDSITPTNNFIIASTNYSKDISRWLKTIGVELSETDIFEIVHMKGSAAIKLFYQLYLALQDKSKLYHNADQKKRMSVRPDTNNRFEVVPVREDQIDVSGFSDNILSAPLVEKQDVIQWHRQRYRTLLEQCAQNREKYVRYIHDHFDKVYEEKYGAMKTVSKLELKEDPLPCDKSKEYTYEELLEMQLKAQNMEKLQEDPKVVKKIVNKIRKKQRWVATEKELKSQMQKMLLLELWEDLLSRQEKEFENAISQKLLKQSLYEKQMATKMLEVRAQRESYLRNRKVIDDDVAKKREEEYHEHFLVRQKSVGDQKFNYYFERDRLLELHRRLYAEKMRLKAERHYAMCKEVVKDIVDLSLRHAEYKEAYDVDVPRRVRDNWGGLFVKSQPIFDLLENPEDIVEDIEDLPEELEEIVTIETLRHNAMDEKEFERYCKYEWPWQLEDNVENYEEDLHQSLLGMNVLGHAVHRVLLKKYPKPAHPEKPDLPKYKVAACVNGIIDLTVLPLLQQLLNLRGIRLIQMQEAINYCLDSYHKEIMTEYPETLLVDETEKALKNLKGKKSKEKPPKKGDKKSPKKGSKKKDEQASDEALLPKWAEKNVQTPLIYPCEEIVLSNKAELGKMAYELLNLGEVLNDNITVAMFVEYLLSLKDIDGWVLVNYPENFEQAALLEEALTSIPIPGMSQKIKMAESIFDYSDLLIRDVDIGLYRDEYKDLRESKILPNPVIPSDEIPYETFLTAYIDVRQEEPDEPKLKPPPPSPLEEAIPEEQEEEEHQMTVEEFYTEQGCHYTLMYKKFDLPTIKHLGKLIIGEYQLPPKTSLEIFGDTLLYVQAKIEEELDKTKSKKGEKKKDDKKKKEKPKKEKPKKEKASKGSEKGSKKGKKGAEVVITREDKEVQVPEPEEEEEEAAEEMEEEEPPEPIAGEPLWRYNDVSIPENLEIALATLWENAENVYIMDFRESIFIKRLILDVIIPYVTFIKKHMRKFIARPDVKQTHLYNFQNMYNQIAVDIRDDAEVKAELHCRINEFREELWKICDLRMRESEEERQRIIRENWVTRQVCELYNIYVVEIQLELDRCVDTLQFILDYFTAEITKMPSTEVLSKISLTKLEGGRELEPTQSLMNLIDVVENLLMNQGTTADETPFNVKLNETYLKAFNLVKTYQNKCLSEVESRKSLFAPGKKKGSAKKSPPPKKGVFGRAAIPKFMEPEQEVKDYGARIVQEFECAVKGEIARAKLRLSLIKAVGQKSILDAFHCTQKAFHELFNEISERYEREMNSVDQACEVFQRAVEAEVAIQPEMVFKGDTFYIDPNVILFPEPPIIPDLPISEHEMEGVFTIVQLDHLVDILMDLAPEGSLPERAFVYLLQDMTVQDGEDGRKPPLPETWTKLKPQQVSELVSEIFGHNEYVDWKDFVVYNLSVPFPTEEELMKVREQFRNDDPDITETVKDYQYSNVTFWFEEHAKDHDHQEAYRLRLIKNLLYRLYRVNEDTINYTALLLAFCKDDDPIVGFAKALEVSLGKYVCWDPKLGEEYIEYHLNQRMLHEQQLYQEYLEHEDNVEMAQSIVGSLISETVHVCDSVIIEDYVSEEEEVRRPSVVEIKSPKEEKEGYDQVSEYGKVSEKSSKSSKSSYSAISCTISLISEEKFSNIEIGFIPTEYKPLAYFLPFELLLTVMTASLPWHSRVQNVEDSSFRENCMRLYNLCQNSDFNDSVFVHEFLNSDYFRDVLEYNFKFNVKDPPRIVSSLIQEKEDFNSVD